MKVAAFGKEDAVRLTAHAAIGFAASALSMTVLALFHKMPPMLPSGAVLLALFLAAPERRRSLFLIAAAVSFCLGGAVAGLWAPEGSKATAALTLSIANTAGVLAAYGLIRRFGARRTLDFANPHDLALFGASVGVAAPVVTVSLGMGDLYLQHALGAAGWLSALSWACAVCLGMLIVAPGLLMLGDFGASLRRTRISKAGLSSLALLALVTALAFGHDELRVRYMVPIALAFVAIFLEFLGVAVGGLIVAVLSTVLFLDHRGGIYDAHNGYDTPRVLQTQLFMIFTMVANLPFAALLTQRRRMRDSLMLATAEAEAARAEAVEQRRRGSLAEEITKVGFWRSDFRTGKVEWSDQLFVILGRGKDQPLFGGVIDAYVHPDDFESRKHAFERLREGKTQETAWRAVLADGQVRHLVSRGVPEFDQTGAVCASFGTVSDVTELTLAQAARNESAARLRLITENVADIIVQTDLADLITYVSPSIEARLGYRPEEVMGRAWVNLLHPADAPLWSATLKQLLDTHGQTVPDSIRCRAFAKDGREMWLGLRPTLVFDEKTGAPTGFVDVARDVTERNKLILELESARAGAEKAAAVKAEFLANMSHEIRTPLTSISGFTQLIQAQSDLNPDTRRFIDRIASGASALLAIVNDVLDFSKLEAGEIRIKPQPTEVQTLMRETLDLFSGQAAQKGLNLSIDYPSELPARLDIDPDRLRQVVINLTGNAMKFTEQGGASLKAAYDAAAQRLRIDVVDTGPGIAPEALGLLFQRFSQVDGSTTRKFGGTGLGLAICKGLVEAMGGQIGVESEPGHGACFWFSIPARPAEASGGAAAVELQAVRLEDLSLLVVDDNPVNRELVRAVLTPLGVRVTEAGDGSEAVRQAAGQPFDVILMDLRMPVMSGSDAARQIRRGQGPNARTPIVAFSADSGEEAALGPLAAHGFCARLIKPFKTTDLIVTLATAAERPVEAAARGAA